MNKTWLKKNKSSVIAIAVLLFILTTFYNFFYNTQYIKGEEVIGTYPSPGGTYILTTYLNNRHNMTVDFAVLGRVKNTKTHLSRNIYWQYHCNIAEVEWLDETTVVINDQVLNVKKDVYDYRKNSEV
ncbi:MAG: DUF5412 family protein [Candidatus Fimivivens sp.]|nr:DUF5412 family protein [Candidatus Fimivivens sp.]